MKFLFPFSGCYAIVVHVIFKSSWVAILKGLEDIVYEVLHAGWGIGWSKTHYSRSIESSGCFKFYKIFGFLTIMNVPIAVAEVEFTKEYHSVHPFDNGVDAREGEDIFDCDSIDFLIIKYGAVTPIFLFNIEDGC